MTEDIKILYSEDQLRTRVRELAHQICNDYQGKKPVLVGILKGSVVFLSDLLRELHRCGLTDVEVDFMTVSSYGSSKEYQGSKIIQDVSLDVTEKDLLIVEDIIDTGHTLSFITKHLSSKHPASVSIVTMLDKKERREAEVPVSYIGFPLKGSPWVEGYGLDGGKYGRGRPDVVEKISHNEDE